MAASAKAALDLAVAEASGGEGAASALYRSVELAPGESRTFFVVLVVAASRAGALSAARKLMSDPGGASSGRGISWRTTYRGGSGGSRRSATPIPGWCGYTSRLPAVAVRPLESGENVHSRSLVSQPRAGLRRVNSYAWDFNYAAIPLTLLDPGGMRAMLVALLSAPLTEHYSIEPVRARGSASSHCYNPYSFTSAVDQFIRATGDRAILRERMQGRACGMAHRHGAVW